MHAMRILVAAAAVLCVPLPGRADTPRQTAEQIERLAGAKAGLCVQLDCADGQLLIELARGGRFLAHGLCAEPAKAAAVRRSIAESHLDGIAGVECLPAGRLPYAENLVNLLVAEDFAALLEGGLDAGEVLRVLCPGGTACLAVPADRRKAVEARLAAAGIKDGRFQGTSRLWLLLVKPRPAGMDEWTHARHGPDGNVVSGDLLIERPNRIQWIMGQHWSDRRTAGVPGAGSPLGVRSAGGRNFYVLGKEGPFSKTGAQLMARDAFNGVLLWVQDIGGLDQRFLIASGRQVYLLRAGEVVCLDAATGGLVRSYGKAEGLAGILLTGGLLLCSDAKGLQAFDAATGKRKWSQPAGAGAALFADGGRLFCGARGGLACIDPADGAVKWRKGGAEVVFAFRGKLLLRAGTKGEKVNYGLKYTALAGEDGRELWSYACDRPEGRSVEAYFASGLVWIQSYDDRDKRDTTGFHNPKGGVSYKWEGLEPDTGKSAYSFLAPVMLSYACHPIYATERFCIGRRPIYFTDWKDQTVTRFEATRGACQSAFGLANGMFYGLYTDSPMCNCVRPAISGVSAFCSDGATINGEVPTQEHGRLQKGPAAAPSAPAAPAADDWPVYRHDMRRSAATPAAVPAQLAVRWHRPAAASAPPADAARAAPGGKLLRDDWLLNKACGDPVTAPTVAAGKVFLCRRHAQQVVAMDAATGQVAWTYLAPARLDAPPTVHQGLCLLGGNDGWVFCLRADDGRLLWRFRAAPDERRIVAYGQVESAWPVVGGVLVADGLAYVVAGRTTEADGGLYIHALDPATGECRWSARRAKSDDGPIGAWNLIGHSTTYSGPADVLCSDGASLAVAGHLRGRFDCKTGQIVSDSPFGVHFGWMRSQFSSQNQSTQHPPIAYAEGRSVRPTRVKDKQTGRTHSYIASGGKADWKVELGEPTMNVEALAMTADAVLAAVSGVTEDGAAELWALAAADGSRLATIKLPAPPAFDGLAVGGQSVFLCLQDGSVVCLAGQ